MIYFCFKVESYANDSTSSSYDSPTPEHVFRYQRCFKLLYYRDFSASESEKSL